MLVPAPSALVRMVLTTPIRLYQQFLSPALEPRCRCSPSCSACTLQAIETHGAIRGIVLGCWRFLRCSPWSLGGIDHVPEKRRQAPDPWIPPEDWVNNAIIERPLPMDMSPNMEGKDSIDLEDEGQEVSIRPGGMHHPINEVHSPDLVPGNHPARTGQSKGTPGIRTS